MSLLDSVQRHLKQEKLTALLQAKIKPSESKRVEDLVKRLNESKGLKMTRSSLTRALVLEGVERLEQELNEST